MESAKCKMVRSPGSIQPFAANPSYWEYKGKPLVLLGGSNDDNLYQWTGEELTEHLDLLITVGGNYLRNTMSDRDPGNVFAFKKVDSSKYDLTLWNKCYWNRLDKFLEETEKREIIIQLTLWDQHDHGRQYWEKHPWNGKNNVNYDISLVTDRDDFYGTVKKV